MIAGKKFSKDNVPHWPLPSKTAMDLWATRHPAFRTFSPNYMASQRRMLILSDIAPSARFEAFEKLCFERVLKPTTAESYWSTWLGIQKALNLTPSEADARVTKLLKARAAAYPVQFPTPASIQQMMIFVQTYRDAFPSLTAVAMMAFLNGQRISDMVQLGVADLMLNDEYLMITVRRGKTVPTTGPYTLWMRRNEYPTETLIATAQQAMKEKRLFLFSDTNANEEREKILQKIKDMIFSIDDDLELRSFRRGGLQRMASLGFNTETLLQFSRHTDAQMLMRYLNWGQHSAHRQQTMIQVLDATTHNLDLPEIPSTVSELPTTTTISTKLH